MTTLLVSMSRTISVYGTHPVQYAVMRGRKVLDHGQGVADEMQAKPGRALRLSLDSPANLTERLQLRALSRRFVPVLVQRHLSDSGVFTERFRSRCQTNWLRQGEAEVDVLAMLEDDADLARQLLQTPSRPMTHLMTAEAAVAALVGAATLGSVLVHWWHSGGLRSLGIREGRVVWQRMQAMDLGAPSVQDNWRTLLDAASAAAPQEFSGGNVQMLRLGQGPWAGAGEWGSHGSSELIASIAGLLQGVSQTEVLAQPDLYGLAFAPMRESLINNGYRQQVMAWQWAPGVAGVAAAAGALLLGVGSWWHLQASQEMLSASQELAALTAQAQALDKLKPPADAVAALRSAAWRETALGANLRVDRFLNELMTQMPAGVQIKELRIQRNGSASERVKVVDGQPVFKDDVGKSPKPGTQASRRGAESGPLVPAALPQGFTQGEPVRRMPVAGEPSFQVDINVVLPGGYAAAKLNAESLAERLTRLGRLSDTALTFEDTAPNAPGARLKTKLTIAAGAF